MNSYCMTMYYPCCTCERERISYNINEPPILTLGIQHDIYMSIIRGEEYEETTEFEEEEEEDYDYNGNNNLQDEDLLEEEYGNNTI